MKKFIVLLAIMLGSVSAFAQQTIQSDRVDDFNSVSLSGNLKVELIKADKNSIEILLNSEITKFKWTVSNGTLNVTLRPSSDKGDAVVKIYYSKPLYDISISGGQLSASEVIDSPLLKLSAGSGAKVTLNIETMDLEVESSGNSAMVLGGTAKYLSVKSGEKSKVNTLDIESVSVSVDASLSSEVQVSVEERLIANAKSGATIFYKGEPTIFKDKSSKMSTGVMGSSVLNIGRKL